MNQSRRDDDLPVVDDSSGGPRDFDNVDEPEWVADVVTESGLTKPGYIDDYDSDKSVVAAIGSEQNIDRWIVSDTFVTVGGDDFESFDE